MSEKQSNRVFVGIPVDPVIVEFISSIPNVSDIPARWVNQEDLHITILPPWHTVNVEAEKERLRFLNGRFIHFPLFFHTIETTPRNSPKIVWIRSDMIGSLAMVKQECEKVFHRPHENRTFLPHVTIGRITNSERVIPISEQLPVSIIATQLNLYESHLDSDGAHYEVLESIHFR